MDTNDKIKSYSDSMNSTSNDSVNNEKVNSILSFLNEASSANNDSNNFVPKPFKEFSVDFSQFYDNLVSKKTSQQQNIPTNENSATIPKPKFNNSLSMHPPQKENEYTSIQPKKPNKQTAANSVALSARQHQTKTVIKIYFL